ncbi:hypothetical protein ALC57_02199 [Trachymyrmex cornetzi]|uniref:Uncharacterized protein n=1 Tax=Trachymyrmex cornetzi TaxID=471704 RepID=A0A195EKM9_9HYME|nr:hypothetical protein ALC57_02199 [Trachymyrmex cornetzi]
MYFLMRIRLSTDSSTASASSWYTVQFRCTLMREEQTERIEQKKSGTTLTTRKASFAAWNPRFISHEMKEKKNRKERDIGKLEQISDGTSDSFSEIMATGPKFVLKVPLRHTLLHEIKGGKKKRNIKKREMSHSRWLDR